jgi:biopolymer transport protein ExbD
MEPLYLPGDDEERMMAAINTTPMVDIMLVLLIVFMVTIPVVIHTVPVRLPRETSELSRVRPGTITLAVTADGRTFWNGRPVNGPAALANRIAVAARQRPQPEIDIRGDRDSAYEPIGRVVALCQRAGIRRLGFVTDPPGSDAPAKAGRR